MVFLGGRRVVFKSLSPSLHSMWSYSLIFYHVIISEQGSSLVSVSWTEELPISGTRVSGKYVNTKKNLWCSPTLERLSETRSPSTVHDLTMAMWFPGRWKGRAVVSQISLVRSWRPTWGRSATLSKDSSGKRMRSHSGETPPIQYCLTQQYCMGIKKYLKSNRDFRTLLIKTRANWIKQHP